MSQSGRANSAGSRGGRVKSGGTAAVALALLLMANTAVSADHGWPLPSFDRMVSLFKSYLPPSFAGANFATADRGDKAVLIMKLGMGIPYCKGHAATIAVRKGRSFQAVAVSRTLRGVRARNIGLTAVQLNPGTYYIVHGTCHVGNRGYHVGAPGGRSKGARRFTTSYAKFVLTKGEVMDAGFLRFFPPYRGRGQPKIKLQATPRKDLKFIASRYPNLVDDLHSQLMRRTNAAGDVLGGRRKRKRKSTPRPRRKAPAKVSLRRKKPTPQIRAPVKKAKVKVREIAKTKVRPVISRRQPIFAMPPIIRKPDPPPVKIVPKTRLHPLLLKPLAKPKVINPSPDSLAAKKIDPADEPKTERPSPAKSSMSLTKRREACKALLQLKREGKVQQLPSSCLHIGLSGLRSPRGATGLPPSTGNDK